MSTNRYLEKHALQGAMIKVPPRSDLSIIVVIPSYDEDEISLTLGSLCQCTDPGVYVEVIVFINYPQSAETFLKRKSKETHRAVEQYSIDHQTSWLTIHSLLGVTEEKKAGVGLARKLGMDEAVRRLEAIGRDGIIVNLDADCTVSRNYFAAIHHWSTSQPEHWAASIYFEHQLQGVKNPEILSAIIAYELHLRYFIEVQKYAGLPFAFQTIGSAMAVRSSAYQKMGGMNVRKAGEDFYFLHKFIAINKLGEINNTAVYPSPRPSHRVPFGTGKAVKKIIEGTKQRTYNLKSFIPIIVMNEKLIDLHSSGNTEEWINDLPKEINEFFRVINAEKKLDEIRRESTAFPSFRKRYYKWFNAFRLMKYLHFCRRKYPDVPVVDQASAFLKSMNYSVSGEDPVSLLNKYRELAVR